MDEQLGSRPGDRGNGQGQGAKPDNNGRFNSAPESLGYADLLLIGSVCVSHGWFAKRVVCRFPAANPTYDKERHENRSVTGNQKDFLECDRFRLPDRVRHKFRLIDGVFKLALMPPTPPLGSGEFSFRH